LNQTSLVNRAVGSRNVIHGMLCLFLVMMAGISGCGKTVSSTPAQPAPPKKKTVTTKPKDYVKLFPADTIAFFRINDVQRAKKEFIQSRYVKDALAAKKAWNAIIEETFKAIRQPGNSYGVSGFSLLQMISEIKSLAVGILPPSGESSDPEGLAIVKLSNMTGFADVQKQLEKKLTSKTIGKLKIQIVAGSYQIAFHQFDSNTLVIGTESSVTRFAKWFDNSTRNSLNDSPQFQQARTDFGSSGDLFAYFNGAWLQGKKQESPAQTISHLAGSLGVDGGFALRGYTAPDKSLPKYLIRKPHKKTFLARMPAKTALFISSSFDENQSHRLQFSKWITHQLTSDDVPAGPLVPPGWKQLAQTFLKNQNPATNKAIILLNDLWFGYPPVKTETAILIAPNDKGYWGTAAICDTTDTSDALQYIQRIRELARQAKLNWKTETVDGLKIHSVAIAGLLKAQTEQTTSKKIEQLIQPRFGYAESENLLLIGSVDLIKYAHRPTGKTLAEEFSYTHIDEESAILFSIRPGSVLNRTSGFEPVDRILKKLAAQIPVDSNYAVTINSEAEKITLRSNIPFTSLVGWLALEWMGKGPAKLKQATEPELEKK
jgi:hypothetical protein